MVLLNIKKNHQLKKLVTMLKEQCIKLRNYNIQINSSSTKDKTNIQNNNDDNNKVNNESMEANTSQINIWCNLEESEFNYIIKEYNKNICETLDK